MNTNQFNLFETLFAPPSLESRVQLALGTIVALFEADVPVCVAYSGGKDSGVCADLTLRAAVQVAARGRHHPLVVVTTSDTLVENPEITQHYRRELQLMRAYARKHGIRLLTRIAQPSLLATWQMKILTGRGLPSFAGQNTDCSYDLKIAPQAALRKSLFKELREAGMKEPVTILGTRFAESEKRSLNMLLRGENDITPVRNSDGDLILSPICDWETDDVFEYLGTRDDGMSFSDFSETLRIYAHSEGTSCAVVAAAIEEGGAKRKKGGCGTRTGCHVCQQSSDRSLENLIEFDQRYEYARGLNKLNKFIRATRYDLSRRHWVGRTIKAGYVAIEPDTYHPKMVRELFRYMVQLQHDEQERAQLVGETPKFILFTEEMILALDAYWSLNGLAEPFAAWADVDDIRSGRVRYEIPELEPVPMAEMPPARFLYVGKEWDDTRSDAELPGLRDNYLESLLEISACSPALRETANGRQIWDIHAEPTFTVDAESLAMMLDFEMERLLEKHREGAGRTVPGAITHGYKWYLSYGVIQPGTAQVAKHDEILRRTALKDRLGLTLEYDIEQLLGQATRFADLPEEARKAWSKKATTASAQADLALA